MAGLLDYLFDPSTYGGQSGGLLARLQPMLAQLPESQGFNGQPVAGSSSFAERFNALPSSQPFTERFSALPNADAPAMATPMKIGDYQMPRLGSEAQYAAIPQSAQSTQGQLPPQQAMQQPAPQAQPQQALPQQALPPALGGGASSILGRIGNPEGLIARLTGNDSRSIARQNLKAQYEALVPIVGPQKAMLAVMNPEAGKTIFEQALASKQKFGVIGKNDGVEQYGFINERDQTVKPIGVSGELITSVPGPDGKPIPIPEGLDAAGRKTFMNHVAAANADAATGKKTEVQAKSEKFGNKMEIAESNMRALQGQGTSLFGHIASGLPLGNYAQSKDYQRYEQAKNNFITALLRDESGAAIGTQEFRRYERELFPQPGDSAAVMAQKAEARRVAIEGMKKGAGPGYKSPTMDSDSSAAPPQFQEGMTATNPQTGQKLTFRNGKWQ